MKIDRNELDRHITGNYGEDQFKEDQMTIEIEVEDVTGQMLLKQHVGEGKFDGNEVTIRVALPTMSPIIHYKDKTFLVSIHEITKAVCDAYDKND